MCSSTSSWYLHSHSYQMGASSALALPGIDIPYALAFAPVQVSGQLIIETFQGMSFFQAIQFGRGIIPPLVMKQNMAFMNQCAPYRLRGIWLFHQGTVVSILMVRGLGGTYYVPPNGRLKKHTRHPSIFFQHGSQLQPSSMYMSKCLT